jgi:glutamate racemase
MKNNPIGVVDSGVGGLSIWKEVISQLPNESTIYLADSANCPYGSRQCEEIYVLAQRMVKFLIDKNVKLIVIACNTMTVCCIDRLRRDFPHLPIVGVVPVIKTAALTSKNKHIGILSTVSTANSMYQKELIEKFSNGCTVINKGTDKLVPLVENGIIDGNEVGKVLTEELEDFKTEGVDVIALGCTHFPFLKEKINKILGSHIAILDSGGAVARQVHRVLEKEGLISVNNTVSHEFHTTGNTVQFDLVMGKVLGKEGIKMVKSVQKAAI